MENTGIAVAGCLIADLFYEIDTYPQQGLLTNVRSTHGSVGGTGNLIIDLARLDKSLPVRVSALVGEDDSGEMIRRTLRQYSNIDQRNITCCGQSSVDHVMEPMDTKQRTFFYHAGASDIYDESYIDWEAIASRIFHLEYLLLMKKVDAADNEYGTHGARILHDARERGMLTSIDMVSEQSDRVQRIITAALPFVDYCTINEIEAESVTGIAVTNSESAYEALQMLKMYGVSRWAVIHCPRCGYGLDCITGEFVVSPSLQLPEGYIHGTTGAGDAYCSGILYGAYTNMPITKAMCFASAAAACSLSGANGTDGLRSAEKVWEIFSEFQR